MSDWRRANTAIRNGRARGRRLLPAAALVLAACAAAVAVPAAATPAQQPSGERGDRATATEVPSGCQAKGRSFRTRGPRKPRKVALTFDGGPTRQYTPRVLRKLERWGVKSTFFIRGQFIRGNGRFLRQELADGHELANHSFTHPRFPSSGELKRTTRAIRAAAGYTPCLFRAPYGAVNAALVRRARQQGMLTIGWTVDSWDSLYENVSATTVYSRVVRGVRPGSIILMHDGEGSHRGTLRALGPILRVLKRRKLEAVTVSELLGLRQKYPPLGG